MASKDAERSGSSSVAAAEAPGRAVAGAPAASPATFALAGPDRLGAPDVLRLQRMVGNRHVGQIVQRKPYKPKVSEDQRAMIEGPEGGKTDEVVTGPDGSKFVWDDFDKTLTIFFPEDGPQGGQAIQATFRDKKWTDEELKTAKAEDFYTSVELLSPLRAKAMEWLRKEQGTFQEDEDQRKERVKKVTDAGAKARTKWLEDPTHQADYDRWRTETDAYNQAVKDWQAKKIKVLPPMPKAPAGMPTDARTTLCNLHTGDFATALSGGINFMNMMDPRTGAAMGKRAGAFHTLESHPKGPRPGDIVSYGAVGKPLKKGGLRTAQFLTTMHVGVFKSRRPGPGGSEIWTVVDGGQGAFEKRQETRERTRIFTKERLIVSIPKISQTGKLTGWEKDTVEMECGVLKSKLADAGQTDADKLLRGWVDIDEYFGKGTTPEATSEGANNRVFAGSTVST